MSSFLAGLLLALASAAAAAAPSSAALTYEVVVESDGSRHEQIITRLDLKP